MVRDLQNMHGFGTLLLYGFCPFCKHVVSSKYVSEVSKQNMNANGTVSIECPNCYNCFDHLLKSTRGDCNAKIVPGKNYTARYNFCNQNCAARYSFGCEKCTNLAKSVSGSEKGSLAI